MKTGFTITLLLVCMYSFAQDPGANTRTEQQLEDLAEAEESETEDEFIAQQLMAFRRHPLNLNDPSVSFSEFPLFSAQLADNLSNYIAVMGELISIYELQAVPGFDADFIKTILPYITVAPTASAMQSIRKRLSGGQHTFLIRPAFSSKLYFRYKYQYANTLQYGAVGERDAGESSVIDFYSLHLFGKTRGWIKTFAIGDYVLNIGQGLVHWQSQAFRKSSSVLNIKRQAEVLRPYHSAGEYNFQRGAAATLQWRSIEATNFVSVRKLDGNRDTDPDGNLVITSVNTSGLHRSKAELADRNSVQLLCMGSNIRYGLRGGHLSASIVRYSYSLPLLRRDEPYNIFSMRGKRWANYSVDFSNTFRNVHLFGEFAMAENGGRALLAGALASLHESTSIGFLYRDIGQSYQTPYGNAFTENTMPTNEKGIYTAVSVRPHLHWSVDAYADVFKFPWLKYRVNAPSRGSGCLLQIIWKPRKVLEAYVRMRWRSKPLNTSSSPAYPAPHNAYNYRMHVNLQMTQALTVRSRLELVRYADPVKTFPGRGFLIYGDLLYKPQGKWYSANCRLQAFEADSYDARVYAYENDVLFASTTPSFFDRGIRMYLNLHARVGAGSRRKTVADIGVKGAVTAYQPMPRVEEDAATKVQTQLRIQLIVLPRP